MKNKKPTEYPLRFMVMESCRSKLYPEDVHKFLKGLYGTLFLASIEKDLEKVIFYAYRNGYELGAASKGADVKEIHDRLPSFGLDDIDTE